MNIKQLILQGEHETLDFKNTISNVPKIAKTLVAFANNKGGSLLVGVADDGTIKGVKDEEEEKYMLLKAGSRFCRPAIDLAFEELYIDDKLILKVNIPEGDVKPYYAVDENEKWWAYIRIADKSVLASRIILEVLKNAHKEVLISYSEDEKKLFEHLKTHQTITLKQFSKLTRKAYKKAQKTLASLIITGVIKVHYTLNEEYFSLSGQE